MPATAKNKKGKETKKQKGGNQLVNSAIEEGIGEIVKAHPVFRERPEYIMRHIDQRRLNEKLQTIGEYLQNGGISDEEKEKYIFTELTNYVASGKAFDEEGQEVILNRSLEEKSKSLNPFKRLSSERNLKGKKYLNNTIKAFQELYGLLSSGDYAQRMPEVAEAITTIHDMGWADPAIKVLEYHGIVSKRRYNYIRKRIVEKTKKAREQAVSGIENLVLYQKAAAVFFGLLGSFTLLMPRITGGAIGTLSNSKTNLIGLLTLFVSLILFLISHKNKKYKSL